MTDTLTDLADEIHRTAVRKGFYDRPGGSLAVEKLCLIHSEVSEIVEALRDDNPAGEAEELADVVIRCLDYAAFRGIDIDAEIAAKMAKNRVRPRLHGRQF